MTFSKELTLYKQTRLILFKSLLTPGVKQQNDTEIQACINATEN